MAKQARRREPSRDRANLLVATAIQESWGIPALAKAAGVSTNTAGDVLATFSNKIIRRADRQLGELAEDMRRLAYIERPAVAARLQAVGSAADDLISLARSWVAEMTSGKVGDDEPAEDEQGKPIRGQGLQSREDKLTKLASVIQRASAASVASWGAFKDASGLQLAEDVRRVQLVAEAKARADESAPNVVDVEVEFG